MEKLQRKNFAIFVVGIMLISTIACQSLFLNKITELQVEEKNSTANAPSASQHNISTPYMYTINQISNSVVYNASFTMAKRIQVYGEYLFFIREDTNLGVLNVSNPSAPINLEYFTFPSPIIHFQPNGTSMYVALSDRIIQMDIQNPANMQMVNYFDGYLGDILSFLVVDSTLYLTLNVGGVCWLQIYTNYFWQGDSYISNFSLGSDYFRRIVNIQNKLLVGSDSGNIKKFFVYDPATPMYINQTNLFYNIKSMELFGNKLVVTDSEHFIIMNPESFDISLILPISNIVGYSIQGNLAYLANNLGTVFIMNITDITKTNAIAHLIFETSLYGLAIFGNILFVSTQNIFYGIKTARMFDEPLNQLVYPGLTVNRVRIFGDYAYICTSSDIKILDLHNNSIVGSYSHSGQAVKDCYQNGDLLYVLFEDSVIRYIDIANPNNPFFVNEFYTGLSNAFSMEASGKYLYVCLLGSGVEIVNMSNPNALSIVAVIPNALGSFAYDCAIVGDHLYIINYNELCVYNILIPEYPINIINITAPYIYSVGVSYPFLFVGTTLGYTVYNISSNTPTWIMAFDTGGSNSMAIKRSGEFLLVGSAGSGLKMIDVKSADRNDIKYNNMTGTIESIDAFYDKMILAQYTDGFLVSKIRETPLDFSNGVPFLEIFWLNKTTANDTVPTNPPSETPDDGQNNPSPFNWNSLLTFGGPPLVILAIVYLIIKSKGKSGPKAKKIKAITKNKIDKGNVSNPDEFFDSDF